MEIYQVCVTYKNGDRKKWYHRDLMKACHKYVMLSSSPSVSRVHVWHNKCIMNWPPLSDLERGYPRGLNFNERHDVSQTS